MSNYVAKYQLYSIICLTVVKLLALLSRFIMLLSDNKKKNNILNSAFELFLENGYEATSIRQICKKAGIEPPTLYHFFGSKKSLFFSMLKLLWDYCDGALDNDLCRFKHAEDKLFHIYSQNIKYTIRNPQNTRFFLRFAMFPPKELEQDIQSCLIAFMRRKGYYAANWSKSASIQAL